VLAGDIIGMAPPGAWFSTGMTIAAQPELNVPMSTIMLGFAAYACAFWLHLPESQEAAWAVASSHAWNATL
jgi:hypothetical protein